MLNSLMMLKVLDLLLNDMEKFKKSDQNFEKNIIFLLQVFKTVYYNICSNEMTIEKFR